MIFVSQQDKDEYEIHITSLYGVSVDIRKTDKHTDTIYNVVKIHWLPSVPNIEYSIPCVVLTTINNKQYIYYIANFFWLSFTPSSKIES